MAKVKETNYEKFQVRGAIKEIMRNLGLRAISISNYYKWLGKESMLPYVHSVRYDIMNGYIRIHTFGSNGKSGPALENVSMPVYSQIYSIVLEILGKETLIPAKVRRNILVKINR